MGLKRILPLFVATLAMVVTPLTAVGASDEPWQFEGGGWGHGIGLSQYGAQGQALAGRNATQILQFYYQGTSVANMPAHWTENANGLWVGLVSNTTSVNLSAVGGPITVCLTADCSDSEVVAPGEDWKFEVIVNGEHAGKCRLRHQAASYNSGPGECSGTISNHGPSNRVEINNRQYARGTVRFDPSQAGFHVVVTLKMQDYLYGLAEVPSSWHTQALRAQAIIGRAFALATAHERGKADGSEKLSSCGCHIRSTTADQAYNGWHKESEPDGDRWVAAVNDTNRKIITHPQSHYYADVAKSFYSSSNGGASENNEDVWPGEAIPWLRSVDDPWSADPNINPLAQWSVKVSDADMATYFGWDRALDAFVLQGPPNVLIRFTGKIKGQDVDITLNGTQVATLLKTIGFGYQPVLGNNTSIRVSPYISGVADPPGFDDSVGHIFETAIDWMLDEEITVGCNPPSNTLYCPDDPVTRGQMAVFVSRLLGLPSPAGDYFGDDNGAFYESAANRLFEAGITVGCDDGRFCGGQRMTRGQMSAFIVRAKGDLTASGTDHFVDDNGSMFENAINKMADSGITQGCNPPANDRYCPNDSVTRGQMATFFRRGWGP